MRTPVALLTLPYLAGTLAALLLHEQAADRFVLAAAAGAALALIAATAFAADDEPGAALVAVVCGALLAGYGSAAGAMRRVDRPSLLTWCEAAAQDEPVVIEGTLIEDGAGGMLSVHVHRVETQRRTTYVEGGVRLFVGGAASPVVAATWRAGRTVRANALLRLPGTFRNPGVSDDRKLLARRGIALTGSVKSATLVEVLERGSVIEEAAAAVRLRVRATLHRSVGRFSPRSAAVAIAILIGDRTGLSDEDERRLQDAGTYHVIAISGGNIAILTVVLIATTRLLRVEWRVAPLICIAVLCFYGEVAGGTASVTRAIAAAVLVLMAMTLDHRASPLNVLGCAALGASAANPTVILDAGFLLSFGATLGILVGAVQVIRPLNERFSPRGRIVRRIAVSIAGVMAATCCAEVVLVPISASLFSRVTGAGLVLNLVAIPLMTVLQCAAMLLTLVTWSSDAFAGALALIVHLAATGLVDSARLVDLAPWVVRDVVPPAWWICMTYYGAVGLSLLPRWRRWFVPAAVSALLVIVIGPKAATSAPVGRLSPDVLRVTVFDVGQGDAVVISTPSGKHLLVDSGGLPGSAFDIGGRILIPALRALGVRRLEGLVLTHGDPDHVGGAEAVIVALSPANVWEGVPVPPHEGLKHLRAAADAGGIGWRTVGVGTIDRWGDVEIRVLHPPAPEWERQRVRNDDSVVLEIRYRDVSVLLPGDIGAAVERGLVPTLDLRPVVVLKAAHHGSATSSSDAFLDAVRPGAVIYSAGANNRFGHPARAVVERFEKRSIPSFNTAVDGAVFVETDGRQVSVWGWASKRRVLIQRQPAH